MISHALLTQKKKKKKKKKEKRGKKKKKEEKKKNPFYLSFLLASYLPLNKVVYPAGCLVNSCFLQKLIQVTSRQP